MEDWSLGKLAGAILLSLWYVYGVMRLASWAICKSVHDYKQMRKD